MIKINVDEVITEPLQTFKRTEPRLYGKPSTEIPKKDEDFKLSSDIINEKTGKIFYEAGFEIDEDFINFINEKKITKINILKVDNIEIGSYIRSTLQLDKVRSREEALFEIFKLSISSLILILTKKSAYLPVCCLIPNPSEPNRRMLFPSHLISVKSFLPFASNP